MNKNIVFFPLVALLLSCSSSQEPTTKNSQEKEYREIAIHDALNSMAKFKVYRAVENNSDSLIPKKSEEKSLFLMLEKMNEQSSKINDYYWVDKDFAYQIFSVYMQGIFSNEEKLNNYIIDNEINYEELNNDSECDYDEENVSISCKTPENKDNKTKIYFKDKNPTIKLNNQRIILTKEGQKEENGIPVDFKLTLDKPSDVIDDSIFAFDENHLYLGDESNVSVLKINDIKTINIDVDNTIYSQSWIATFNDKKVKFNVNDIQILPLLNSITYILNQYKDEKNNSIEISMSEKASGIIQSKDIWEKYLIKYSGSVENSLNLADDVSDGILVLGAFETGGISLASMAEKKLAVKAAKKLIVREVLERASKHPIKFATKAYMETRKLYPKISNLKGYTKEGIQVEKIDLKMCVA